MLEISDLSVNYGGIKALQQVSLRVETGEIVTLIGANGAGKSTTLRAISQLIKPVSGRILYNQRDLTPVSPHRAVSLGIAHSPEGRQVLTRQTVLANLQLGAYVRPDRRGIEADLDRQFQIFPRLAERKHQLAGTLSGGEQQMLAIARAVMSRPRLLLLDEPSLGLAPQIVREIFSVIRQLRDLEVTILLVEQNAHLALEVAHRAYILETGEIALNGPASELRRHPQVLAAYLGGA
jgi:branched-chain amino acid transport system ATP-binding protein